MMQGYAWAAASYRSAGYRVDWFVDDMLALRELVVGRIVLPAGRSCTASRWVVTW
jgi:hypothetical protein